ncbi:hypothetical protein JG688_00018391 [Phytophthora aleatoria]|uniref:Uncharacterized protein n=1 Tax=Phytophthora aleatoria TaxID=2496075 RepID=A0A8J5IAZ6_9STRA|nr:hypothetical protein JG688_00018391 [Phytophthora aleatoria]
MIRNRRKARDVSVTDHVTSLRQLATLIMMLPENKAPLSEKSLMYHFRKSMPFEWQTKYDESGREASTVTELTRYVTRQEINADRKDARPRQRKDSSRHLPMQQRTKESKQPQSLSGQLLASGATTTARRPTPTYQQKRRADEVDYCASHHFNALVDAGASKTLIDAAVLNPDGIRRNRTMRWTCAVAEQLSYEMIFKIEHLGLIMDFKAGEFIWDDVLLREESVIAQADRRQIKISDADYQKEPLDEHVPDFLNADEQADLLDLLKSLT